MANKIENEKMEDKLKQDAVIEKVEDNQQLNQEISEKDEIENKKKAKNKTPSGVVGGNMQLANFSTCD